MGRKKRRIRKEVLIKKIFWWGWGENNLGIEEEFFV